MVEIAEKLIEAVVGRQELVFVAEVVLAELACGVTERLENFSDTRVFGPQTDIRPRQANLRQAGTDRRLSSDESGSPRGATLFGVPVGEQRSFFGDAVDVGSAIAHKAKIVGAHIEPPDVVAHDH